MLFWMHSEASAIIVCGDRGRASKVIASLVLPTAKNPALLSPTVFLPLNSNNFFFFVFSVGYLVISDIVFEVADGVFVCCSLV